MADVQTGALYPLAENVLNLARSAVNDMLRGTSGSILTDTAPNTNVYLNAAVRRVQRELANNGITSNLRDNVILTPLTPAGASDPDTQVYVSQAGYFDGANMNATPTLPADLIVPLEVWERQTNSGAQFQYMPQPQEGLQSRIPGSYFGQWEWREDRINMTGSTITEDLRVRYEAAISRIAIPVAPATYSNVTIPITDAEDALGAAVALQYARTRGSAMRQEAQQWFMDEMFQLINRHVRRDQHVSYRPSGFRAGGGHIDGSLSGTYK
jgi:hypothetical protein